MIKNIVFDLGSVIVKGTPRDILNKTDLKKEEQEILMEIFLNQKNFDELDGGFKTLEDIFNLYINRIPKYLVKKAKSIFCNYYEYRDYDNNVINLLINLKNNEYNIYILSNNNSETIRYLKNKECASYIDGWLSSSECHITKPNLEIYNLFYQKFNLDPKESLFIDDKEKNIIAGKETGMDGIVFTNYDNLKLELLNRGIKIN